LRKLRKNNVGNVRGIRRWRCLGEILLLVMDALLIGKHGQIITQKKLGIYRGNLGEEHKEEKKALCVGARLGNVIGYDIWKLKSIGRGLKRKVAGEIWRAGAREGRRS